jgi:hypothetical protein
MRQAAKISHWKFPRSPHHCRPTQSPRVIIPDLGRALRMRCHLPQPWSNDPVGVVPEPAMPSTPRHSLYIFYVIVGLQILNFICYIATLLWYTTHWYIAFVLLNCFDLLHCHIALIYYIALICYTLLLFCYITQNTHTLPHCLDMLHIATLLFSATFLSIWIHITLLHAKSGLSEMSVATWTNIVLLRFQLRTTWNKLCIQLCLSMSQSRWSFLLLLSIVLRAGPFAMIEATTQHFLLPQSMFSTESKTAN